MDVLLHGADYNYEQWIDRPEILEQDFALMREAGCNVMAIGIFSWSMYEAREDHYDFTWMDTLMDRLHGNGMKAILATPSGAKPAWMSKARPEICMVNVDGHRAHHHGRHNHCRTSPWFRAKVRDMNTRLAHRYKDHPALLMWHVSNEYNASRCYCEHCLKAFRTWLKDRYGSLEELNKAWWTTFWSHRFSDWDEIYPADSSMNGMMLDWARFTSDQTMDFFRAEVEPLRETSPGVPVTTNFMLPDVGLDYHKFARLVDVVSWDNYPRWHATGSDAEVACRTAFVHDLFRSMKQQPFLMMESTPSNTNWQGVSPLKRPGVHLLASMQAIAHGSDSVQYFQWRQSRGGEEKFHGAVVGHSQTKDTRTFRDVTETGRHLARLSAKGLAGAASQKADVAIVYDFPNGWALDLAQLPRSIDKDYQATCMKHYQAFWKQGVAVDIVSADCDRLSDYKLVVAPMLYLVGKETAARMEAFVLKGGTLVCTYLTGLVDHADLCHEGGAPGPLRTTLGLQVTESDALPAHAEQCLVLGDPDQGAGAFEVRHYADVLTLEGAMSMGVYGKDFLAGSPAFTVNHHGRGDAWYLAARTDDSFLDSFYRSLTRKLCLGRACLSPLPPGVSARKRNAGTRDFLFLMNFNKEAAAIKLDPGQWTDLVSGLSREGLMELQGFGTAILTQSD